MIRITDIQEAFVHLVGWRQGDDVNGVTIADNLTESESGIYFQDVHPLLTLENLYSIAPDFKNYDYPEHSIAKEYHKNEIVKNEEKHFKSKSHVPVGVSLENTDYWLETDPFSEWLRQKTIGSITKAVNRYINDKIAKKHSLKHLCENKTLFDGTGRICDVIKNKNNLVGFELVPIRAKGVTTKINKIGLQFTKPGTYTIYIMHSSSEEPYYVETFVKTKSNSIEWFKPLIDLYLPYETENIDAGGSWYICYKQSDLPTESNAIRKDRDWSKSPCTACSRSEYMSWKLWSRYLEVNPFYVNEELLLDTPQLNLWDIQNNQYVYDSNFGLNLDISVLCDITDIFISQRGLFADFISKQVATDLLRECAYNANVRTNRRSINASRIDILYELDGDSTSHKKSGLNYQLELSLNALEISLAGIDRICLPCVNNGIKYRTV